MQEFSYESKIIKIKSFIFQARKKRKRQIRDFVKSLISYLIRVSLKLENYYYFYHACKNRQCVQ